ncbi:conserved protein of unknown function [Candidatus Promineifilum breve]|uniref:TIGR04255 family protein n=1 Tax=Candidatus Promineifilum breve TaxID=1806508 RepID=A0A160T4A3_9CHLR|nr:hypothetical protein [Candidatus Promineifilum breve]CUS04209.2 conserved protein of unknown function [Candidatus Promineifilum breve]
MKDGLLIHAGINFIFVPQPPLSKRTGPVFQTALIEHGVDVSESRSADDGILVGSREPFPYEARIISLAPNVGQLLILAAQGTGSIDIFSQTAEAILQAYDQAIQPDPKQLLACDVTLRFLYETDADHAFRQLWENRLHQTADSLATLGGPVLGGGLRFVVPLVEPNEEPCLVEVKIESLLTDAPKLYVETSFKWDFSSNPHALPDATRRLHLVDDYVEKKVGAFMDWEENPDDNHDLTD